MWLFTKHGFFSIVRKSPNEYHIRARVRQDLEDLRESVRLVKEISESDDADYRYRLVVGGEVYRTIMMHLLQSVDYDNFKAKIATTEGQRGKLHSYHQVWDVMRRLQDEESDRSDRPR